MDQLDHMDPVLMVHPGEHVTSGGRILASASLVEQAEFYGPHGCLHAVAGFQLLPDMAYVPLDGAEADGELPGDLLVGPYQDHHPQDIDLSGCKGGILT